MLKEYYTEEPIEFVDCDYSVHAGESPDSWDIDDSSFEDSYEAEGYTNYPCAWIERIEKGKPICDIDELVHKVITRNIDRYDAAIEVDWNLDRLIHIRLDLDLRMGKLLTHLKKKGVPHLGYRSIGTFSVEHLSFSGRLASEMMRNFEVLSNLPLTKKAFLQGKIMKSALRYTSRVMTPDNEAEWLSLAQSLSLNELEREVKYALLESASLESNSADGNDETDENGENYDNSNGNPGITQCEPDIPSEESDEERKGVMMNFLVSNKLALIWDFALEHFRDKEHYNGPVAAFVEALCAGNLTSGNRAPESLVKTDDGDLPIFYRCHMKHEENPRRFSIKDLKPPTSTDDEADDGQPFRMPWYIFFPPDFDEIPEKVRDIAKKLIECALMRQALDMAMGKLLWAMKDWSLYNIFKCRCSEEYGIKYCDLSKPLLYRLLKLAYRLDKHPLIRDAFESGMISKEQARLILRIVNKKNEVAWIDYAAHVPTVTLKEEVERCRRILEYDCMAAGYYNILPGFRYITDDRFHELPEEIQDIIRTGAWYQGASMNSSWPLEEDDEQCVMERDRRLEEPWKYFRDVDEFLVYDAEEKEIRRRKLLSRVETGRGASDQNLKTLLCASEAGQKKSGPGADSLPFSGEADKKNSDQDTSSLKCAVSVTSIEESCSEHSHSEEIVCPNNSQSASHDSSHSDSHNASRRDSQSSSRSASHRDSQYDAETISKAREICTMPNGASSAETFLMDILDDDSCSIKGASTMSIRFFLPEELYELWNITAMSYLMQATAEEAMSAEAMQTEVMNREPANRDTMHKEALHKEATKVDDILEFPMHYTGYAEDFLAALLHDYLLTERLHLKIGHYYEILKRDHFECQAPGCKCRRNLQVHHIRWRSKGGGDWECNLLTLCKVCHKHILHDLMALKIEGTAPDNLTFTFGPNSSDSYGPFLIYHKGRKKVGVIPKTI